MSFTIVRLQLFFSFLKMLQLLTVDKWCCIRACRGRQDRAAYMSWWINDAAYMKLLIDRAAYMRWWINHDAYIK